MSDYDTSAFVSLIGAQLEEWSADCMRLSLTVRPEHTNPNGVMHGGVAMTLMDEAMGGVISLARGLDVMHTAPHASVQVSACLIASARAGDELVIEGRPLRIGGTVAFGEAVVRRASGDVVATSRGTFVIARPRA